MTRPKNEHAGYEHSYSVEIRAAVIRFLSQNGSRRFQGKEEPVPEPIPLWNRLHWWNRLQS